MASKAGGGLTIIIVGLVIIIAVASWLVDSLGGAGFTVLSIAVVGGIVFLVVYLRKRRRAQLMEKYGDAQVVDAIIAKNIWQGQSAEQLLDALGRPVDVDHKVLKTKKKEIWKYHHKGGNRFGLRITLENDVVVGWEQKS